MAQTFSGSDLRPSLEAMCPMKVISGLLSSSFSRLSLMPTSTHLWTKSRRFLSWVSSSAPCTMISSAMHITPPSPSRDSLMRRWNISADTFKPKGSLVQRYRPKQVWKAVSLLHSWSNLTCQYPDFRSTLVKKADFPSSCTSSSRIGMVKRFQMRALFSSFGSIQTLRAPGDLLSDHHLTDPGSGLS